jgi:hypothetical protein
MAFNMPVMQLVGFIPSDKESVLLETRRIKIYEASNYDETDFTLVVFQ